MSASESHWQGEPLAVWESLWGIPLFEVWAVLDSTNDRARDLLLESAPTWTVVVAGAQKRGRGRSGGVWESAPGAGLWMSVVLRPRARAQTALLPLLTGLAVARAIEAMAGDRAGRGRVGLKWPNDLLWSGRKIAGILCEATASGVVVGVGINLRAPDGGFAPDHADGAGALEALTGMPWSEGALLGRILTELAGVWEPPVLRFDGETAAAWDERDVLKGRTVRVEGLEGQARGIGADGALLIQTSGGDIASARAGSVQWGDALVPGAE